MAGDTGVEQISTVETTVVGTQVPLLQSLQPAVVVAAGPLVSPRGFTGLALARRLIDRQYTSQHIEEGTNLKPEPSTKADRTNVEYIMLRTPQAKSSKRVKDQSTAVKIFVPREILPSLYPSPQPFRV